MPIGRSPVPAVGQGPTLIEADTYRARGPLPLRSGEIPARRRAGWLVRDPIPRFEQVVLTAGAATPEELESLRDDVNTEVKAALERAKISPEPQADRLYEDVYR